MQHTPTHPPYSLLVRVSLLVSIVRKMVEGCYCIPILTHCTRWQIRCIILCTCSDGVVACIRSSKWYCILCMILSTQHSIVHTYSSTRPSLLVHPTPCVSICGIMHSVLVDAYTFLHPLVPTHPLHHTVYTVSDGISSSVHVEHRAQHTAYVYCVVLSVT